MNIPQSPARAGSVVTVLLLTLLIWFGSAPAATAADYVLVVDVSGSMTNRISKSDKRVRITVVQDALKQYLPSLPTNSRVKLIAFSSGIASEKELVLRGEAEIAQSLAWVNALEKEARKNHDTHLFTTIRYALQTAANYTKQNPDQPVTVRVLTDGEDSQNTTTLDKVLGEFKQLLDGERIRGNLVILGDFELKTKLTLPEGGFVVRKDPQWVELFPPVILMIPVSPRVGEEVRFLENGKSPYREYEWFVDGKLVSQEKVLTWKFATPRAYQVQLKVGAGPGAKSSASLKVPVAEPEKPKVEKFVADFVPLPAKVQPQQEVTLAARCGARAVRFVWSVNGKEVSTNADLVFRFEKEGSHAVRLAAFDSTGNTAARSQTITVTEAAVSARIRGPVETVSGKPVQFAGEIEGPCSSVEWQFGDGTTSKERNPLHSFTNTNGESKEMRVLLRVMSPLGKVAMAEPLTVKVLAEKRIPAPVAAFRIINQTPKAGETIDLVDESSGIIESHRWEILGEGTSTERNPAMAITNPGLKTIRLRVTGPGGSAEAKRTIQIQPRFERVTAGVEVSSKSGTAPLLVRFVAKFSGAVAGMRWDFGDGTSSSEAAPSHTYMQVTNATVVLHVQPVDPEQAPVEVRVPITVNKPRPTWVTTALVVGCIALLAAATGLVAYRRHRAAMRLPIHYWPEDALTCRTVIMTRANETMDLTPHLPLRIKREGKAQVQLAPTQDAKLMTPDGREIAVQNLGQGARILVKNSAGRLRAVAIAPNRKPTRPTPAEASAEQAEPAETAFATAAAPAAGDWSW